MSTVDHETFPDFQEFVALLLNEEQRNGGLGIGSLQESMFYSNLGRGRGHFGGRLGNKNQQE